MSNKTPSLPISTGVFYNGTHRHGKFSDEFAKELATRRSIDLTTYEGGLHDFVRDISTERSSQDMIDLYHEMGLQNNCLIYFEPFPEQVIPYVSFSEYDGLETPYVSTSYDYRKMLEEFMISNDLEKLHKAYREIKHIETIANLNYYYQKQ
jgi:hypothetical protein